MNNPDFFTLSFAFICFELEGIFFVPKNDLRSLKKPQRKNFSLKYLYFSFHFTIINFFPKTIYE